VPPEVRHQPPPPDNFDHDRYLEHSIDLVARVRAARETAEREMETFGHVSEYEIRKIYGQRSGQPYGAQEQIADTEIPATEPAQYSVREHTPEHVLETSDQAQRSFNFEPAAKHQVGRPSEEEE
jgi:hypothetical protein